MPEWGPSVPPRWARRHAPRAVSSPLQGPRRLAARGLEVPRTKTKLSGRRRAERRAAIPWAISEGLVRACETLAQELATKEQARRLGERAAE
jgi:hypothetical protein